MKNIVYVFKNVHGNCSVVNFDTENKEVNSFLSKFDIWGGSGIRKEQNNKKEVWFELPVDFMDILNTESMKTVFKKMNVQVTLEYLKWLDLSDEDWKYYSELKDNVKSAAVVLYENNNDTNDDRFNKAVKELIEFEKKYELILKVFNKNYTRKGK